MLDLMMVICTLADPGICRDRTIQFMPQPGLMAAYVCAGKAQLIIADPRERVLRDGEYVARYWCEAASVFARL